MLNGMPRKPYGKLDNYISMYRRRAGLSQSELATLINVERRASMARYELGLRVPDLETSLALAIVLGQSVDEVFAGLAEGIRDKVTERAQALLEASNDDPTHQNVLKYALLAKLANQDDEQIIPWEDAA